MNIFGFGRSSGDTIKTGPKSNKPTPVKFDDAMTISAFWACTRLLTEAVAAMPLRCIETNPENGTRTQILDYSLWELMNYKPNRYQTRTEFIESIMINLVTRGNAYIPIETVSGRIISLFPLPAAQVEPVLLENGEQVYKYTDANNNVKIFSSESMWHIKLFGNGLEGLSPLQYAQQTLGVAKNLSDRVSTLAENGGKVGGILTIDEVLKPPQREQVRKNFAAMQEGKEDQLFVLEAGMKYQQTSLSPSDMQMIENRRFSIEDIARFMGVPSVLINDTSASTTWGSGIEQINQGFYKLNLRPYLERIESSVKRWLIPQSDWKTIDIEFDFDALLRADKSTRLDAQSKAVNSGLLTPNEGRAVEGLKPKTGGNSIYLNGSLVPAGTAPKQTMQGVNNGD